MQVIIQNSGVSEYNSRAIFDACNELGIHTHCVGIIPFSHELTGIEGLDFSKPSFWYGSTGLLQKAQKDYPGSGVFLTKAFDINPQINLTPMEIGEGKYSNPLRDDFLNPNPRLFEAYHFNDIGYDWLKQLVLERPMFIRPSTSLKIFAGTVLTGKNWNEKEVLLRNVTKQMPNEVMCVSEYIDIWAEWRFFVIDGTVITGSLYKESGRLETRLASPDMCMIAQAFCTKWMPLQTCVIDLALTTDGIKVIEFNSVNSSGLYEADPKKILKALKEIVV